MPCTPNSVCHTFLSLASVIKFRHVLHPSKVYYNRQTESEDSKKTKNRIYYPLKKT